MKVDESTAGFIPLEAIIIASPCHAEWDKMRGDNRSRFCQSCAKNVYDLSGMTREEAQNLIFENEGELCLRLHKRADGTVITSDCPVGLSKIERSDNWMGNLLLTALAAVLGAVGVKIVNGSPEKTMTYSGTASMITTQ